MEFKPLIERKKLKDLIPSEYNPRTMEEQAFYGLGQSLERFGLLAHIVWNQRTGNIVGGHQRYKQLRDRGVEETDVIVVDLDDNEEVALNIALNSGAIKGDFTQGAIAALRLTEARIGEVFNHIKLDGLLETLEKKNKKKEKKPKGNGDGYSDADPIGLEIDMTEGVINCPKCHSKWKSKDNTVLFDNSASLADIGAESDTEEKGDKDE